jgi:hypothetical protein
MAGHCTAIYVYAYEAHDLRSPAIPTPACVRVACCVVCVVCVTTGIQLRKGCTSALFQPVQISMVTEPLYYSPLRVWQSPASGFNVRQGVAEPPHQPLLA